jgi:signal transduction histidine kinase
MAWSGRLIITFIVFQITFCAAAAQDYDAMLAWYRQFFQETNDSVAEVLIAEATRNVEEAKASAEPVKAAHALKTLGLIHLTKARNHDLALDNFIESLTIEDTLGLVAEQVFSYIAIAQVFAEVGNNERSAESLEQALVFNEETGNVHIYAFILNKLGTVYAALGNIEKAFESFELVLANKVRIGQPEVEAEALFNLANLHSIQGNYDEALRSHRLALSIRRSIRDRKNEAHSLNDIGKLYHLMKNDDRALANHRVALQIRRRLGDKKELAESYNNIGEIYYLKKNYDRAIANLNLALAAGLESHSKTQISKSYELLSSCHKERGDFQKALEHKENHYAIIDFIQNEKTERRLLEIQNRYVVDKKESQIDHLELDRVQREKELQTQKSIRNFLYALVALILIIGVLILYSYLQNKKSNRRLQLAHKRVKHKNLQLQQLNATKDKFFSIISHDLRGPLNSLTSFSGLLIHHMDNLTQAEIQTLARDLDESVKNLFGLLENLLEWSRSQTGTNQFPPEPFNLTALLDENKSLLSAQAHNKKIAIMHEPREDVMVKAHRNSINTVIRNLISNAIKFTPEGGAIKLDITRRQGEVIVSVADTGVGMDKEVIEKIFRIDTKHTTRGTANETGTGLGLVLCKEFMEKNGGRIWVNSEPRRGSVFYFALPALVDEKRLDVVPSVSSATLKHPADGG